jgi:hypothetical protein
LPEEEEEEESDWEDEVDLASTNEWNEFDKRIDTSTLIVAIMKEFILSQTIDTKMKMSPLRSLCKEN